LRLGELFEAQDYLNFDERFLIALLTHADSFKDQCEMEIFGFVSTLKVTVLEVKEVKEFVAPILKKVATSLMKEKD
jgi:hypothetical protein